MHQKNTKYNSILATTKSGSEPILKITPDSGGNVSDSEGTITVTTQGSGYKVGDTLIVEAKWLINGSTRLEFTLKSSAFNNGNLKHN